MTRSASLLLAFLAALGFGAGVCAAEEPVPVAGRVSDAVSGAAVAGAEVRAGDTVGRTDEHGRFALSLARGRWTISVTATGYVLQTRTFELGEGPAPSVEIALVPAARFSEHVEVKAAGPPAGPAALPVAPAQVLTVAGSFDNIYHVIQTLPGVNATDEVSSRLSVRGGGPDENLTIMDGVEIHNPYRLLGLTSAFNPETVAHFDFSAGGFGVAYGDRLSSLLVVDNRDGIEKKGLAGSSSLSLTDANVIFEGKLPVRHGSWLLTTRRTYYDLVAERFVDANLPAFRDIQFKAAWSPRDGQRLTLTGVRSREDGNGDFTGDVPDEGGNFLLGVHNDLASAAFQARVGKGVSRTTLAWYGTESVFDGAATFRAENRRSNTPEVNDSPVTSLDFQLHHDIHDVSGRQELSLPLGARHVLDAGFDVHRLRAGVTYSFLGDRNPSEANGSSIRGGEGLPEGLDSGNVYVRGGTWVEDRFRAGDAMTLLGGLRLDGSGITPGPPILSPRFSATLGLGRSTRLRASAGRYTQSPGYEKLIMSDYVVDQVDLAYEHARHLALGFERDFPRGVTARVEVYHKRFDSLVIGRLETEEERQARIARYDYPPELQSDIPTAPLITSTPTNDGRGTAYGVDLYVTRTGPRLAGWLSYTLGKAQRDAYGLVYPFDYDRRHSATLVGSYRFSPRFEMSATARAASGFPRTPFAGIRVASTETTDGRLVPERDTAGRLVYVVAPGDLGELNSARLPFYARLDLRAAFRPHGEKGRWMFYVEAINALHRKNTTSIDGTLEYDPSADRPKLVETRGGSLPFLPTFGVRFRFD